MKVVADAAAFIFVLRKISQASDERRISKTSGKVIVDDDTETKPAAPVINPTDWVKSLWFTLLSVSLWFNLVSTPLIMLWPEISDQSANKNFYYLLWLNELMFILDTIRKFFDPPKGSRALDVYEIAINYIKSTLILDVLATLP